MDLVELVSSAVERNMGIPAMLDAYSEFVDSPIGPLELLDLESVFSAILGNLSERFPQIASRRAATNARNDVSIFLSSANNNPDRVKQVLRAELEKANKVMGASIAERFSRMNGEEKKAIDATLRLLRKSQVEILFRVGAGEGIASSGAEFERFFAAVQAQSPSMKELRFQNLIVEKGIFNKLILKSKEGRNNTIWVPSFFARENAGFLIERLAIPSEHLFLSRLSELKENGTLDGARPFLSNLMQSQGVHARSSDIPREIRDFFLTGEKFAVLTPIELDDLSTFFESEASEQIRAREQAAQKQKSLEEDKKREEALQKEKLDQRREQIEAFDKPKEIQTRFTSDSIYIGKSLEVDSFVSALKRKAPESEIAQVKIIKDYFFDYSMVKEVGVSVVGSSGSGRSTTLKRILDGIGTKVPIYVIDQKGEHRGVAWKYKWNVLAFVEDSQAKKLKIKSFLQEEELGGDLLQEYLLQMGVNCSDQQRARMASVIKAQNGNLDSIQSAISKEPDLTQIASKLSRNILSKNSFGRLFGEEQSLGKESTLYDVSGRGLRDPTTKEERIIASVMILKSLVDSNVEFSVIALEDALDRFKSESLRKKVVHYVSRLREKGNAIVATSRSEIRDFVGGGTLEVLHRLSGEKVINEELAGFKGDDKVKGLQGLVGFLPRGYAFTSSVVAKEKLVPSAIKVEPLQFSDAK